MNYFRSVAIAVDQLLNALIGGWPDESLSSRAYRVGLTYDKWVLASVINALFFWQQNHCKSAYENEQERRHLPPELR